MQLANKLTKVNDSLTVNLFDNGFMVEVSGQDQEGDWKTAKIVCATLDDVFSVITQANLMERS